MMPDQIGYVIGVDTHRDTHHLAICARTGEVITTGMIAATSAGYQAALKLAACHAPGQRWWAIEGTGSYGRGLAVYLAAQHQTVVEIDRPRRRRGRNTAKTDTLDAISAAHQAISATHLATPRADGDREALRLLYTTREAAVSVRRDSLNQLHALIVTAPDTLRHHLRTRSREALTTRCARLALTPPDQHAIRLALRLTAQRITHATREAQRLETDIHHLVTRLAPHLLNEHGIGPITAAQILIAYSHPGRVRSEAAFAALAGTNPIPASSGQTIRHRLNRGGDRQLNRALHTIILSRRRNDPTTIAYLQRRQANGKTSREAIRCLKRYLARRLYRLLEHPPTPTT